MTIHPSSAETVRKVARDSFSPEAPDLFAAIAARRRAGERVILPIAQAAAGRSGIKKRWMIALLIGMAGAAAAMPGSPIRRLVLERFASEEAAQGKPSGPPKSAFAPAIAPPPSSLESAQAGVSIPSRGGPLYVSLDSLEAPVRVVLRLTDRPELEVRGFNSAATATFRPRADAIGVSRLKAGAELRIDIPRSAQSFALKVRGEELAVVAAGQFRSAPRADSIVVTAHP